MRNAEARHLPYHCMIKERSLHGREFFLIEGFTTKLNKGRRLRTKWVTIDGGGLGRSGWRRNSLGLFMVAW
jgi:hypothetical protein